MNSYKDRNFGELFINEEYAYHYVVMYRYLEKHMAIE